MSSNQRNWQSRGKQRGRRISSTTTGYQLATFSYVARRLWPLRKLSEEDRLDIIKKIEIVLADINKSDDIPGWAKAPLVDGLARMQLTLQHLLFFGYEAAIEELQRLYHRTISVEDIIADEGLADKSQAKTILKVFGKLCFLEICSVFQIRP